MHIQKINKKEQFEQQRCILLCSTIYFSMKIYSVYVTVFKITCGCNLKLINFVFCLFVSMIKISFNRWRGIKYGKYKLCNNVQERFDFSVCLESHYCSALLIEYQQFAVDVVLLRVQYKNTRHFHFLCSGFSWLCSVQICFCCTLGCDLSTCLRWLRI